MPVKSLDKPDVNIHFVPNPMHYLLIYTKPSIIFYAKYQVCIYTLKIPTVMGNLEITEDCDFQACKN